MIDFTSRQLRAFVLVAQHGSFSRAAGALFVTPSALSFLIREFETQLGARLFDRTTRRVALTRAGADLFDVVRLSLGELDQTMSRVGQSETNSSLSIGAPPLVAATVLVDAIKEYRVHRPEIRFRVFDTDSTTTIQKVESGLLDMGVGVFFKHLTGITRTLLFRFPLTVIRASTGSTSRPGTTSWSALKGEKMISLPWSLPYQRFIDKNLAKAGIKRPTSLEVNYLSTQIAMVEAGEGIAIIPSYGLLACRNRRTIKSRLINPMVQVDLHQIQLGGKKLPPVAQEFSAFLKTHIAGWAERARIL